MQTRSLRLHGTIAAVLAASLLAGLSGCTGSGGGITSGRFRNSTASADNGAMDAKPVAAAGATAGKAPTPAEAKQRLVEGNARFVSGKLEHPRMTPAVRSELANGQAPFAVILGCSDSRTSPEQLFDQGLGDLFVARVAGNVIDPHVVGSIEYAVEHLHSPLIVVMGHSKCGAVMAAREVVSADGHAEGHIQSLVDALRPAVEQTMDGDVKATTLANVRRMVQLLRESQPIIKHMVDEGKLQVIGAYYDLASGKVEMVED